jgi:hypothetical protein
MKSFCEELINDGQCKKLEEHCFRVRFKKKCEFIGHYNQIKKSTKYTPLAKKVKEIMYPKFMKEWKAFARDPRTGKKRMTGGPLELAIRQVLRQELAPYKVTIYNKAKKFAVWDNDVYVIADCLIEKLSFRSVISVKTWIGTEQIRETFAYAYFAKTWLGQKDIRVYQVGLFPLKEKLKSLIESCKPYLDGVFSLSSDPYFDVLVQTLKHDFSLRSLRISPTQK